MIIKGCEIDDKILGFGLLTLIAVIAMQQTGGLALANNVCSGILGAMVGKAMAGVDSGPPQLKR